MTAEMIKGALVSSFVQITIDNLASRFGDIFRGDKSNKKMLSNLKVKILAVDVVADNAEQKQFTDGRVREWLLQAKDAVFDAEDLLEEIDLALCKTQVEAQSHSTATKVWNSLKSPFVSFFKNEIESRMEKLIENLEYLETQSHVLGLKRNDDVGEGSRSGSKLRSTYCQSLEELPTNLHLLTNLCRLEFIGTKVRKVPPHLGKLKNLKVVMNFNVGHGREFGIQQLGELNIDGSLSIGELQNVENSRDALEADLKNKTHLAKLELRWTRIGNSIDSEKAEHTIQNLEPSKNLKELLISNYAGKQFPNWLLKNSLWNM